MFLVCSHDLSPKITPDFNYLGDFQGTNSRLDEEDPENVVWAKLKGVAINMSTSNNILLYISDI